MTICNSCDNPSQYYVGDIGTIIEVDTCNDITTATLVRLNVQKPDDTVVTWSGSVYDTTKIRHTVVSGDFDQSGTYYVQAYVEMPGWTGRGGTASFKLVLPFS